MFRGGAQGENTCSLRVARSAKYLKHWRLQPRLEAVVRWRYATILHEETENVMEAEEALSKGVLSSQLARQDKSAR